MHTTKEEKDRENRTHDIKRDGMREENHLVANLCCCRSVKDVKQAFVYTFKIYYTLNNDSSFPRFCT